MEEFLGSTPQGLQGKVSYDLFLKDRAEANRKHDREVLESGRSGQFEETWRSADGKDHIFICTKFPLFDPSGKAYAVCGLAVDISERKKSEERMQQMQKLESIGLLAGGVAHDFNNLLTGIMGMTSLVLDQVSPETAEILDSVIKSAERAAQLTRQLLAYAGKGQFVTQSLDLSQAVRDIGDLLRFSIPRTVALRLSLADRLPPINVDSAQLQQIIMNLVINAAEAVGEVETGTVTCRTGLLDVDGSLDVFGQQVCCGRYVYLEVEDTGHGMSAETKSRIFDPFFTTKFAGRGMGLAAVAGLVRAQEGAVTVESEPQKGSRLRIFFRTAHREQREAPEGATAGRGTILIVEDEDLVRSFLSATLRKSGCRVITAADGKEALMMCTEEILGRLKGIVLDLFMPLMGGDAFLVEIKRRRPDIKVLLTSGYIESEVRRLCSAYDGTAFIQKPYTAERLAQVVDAVMGRGEPQARPESQPAW